MSEVKFNDGEDEATTSTESKLSKSTANRIKRKQRKEVAALEEAKTNKKNKKKTEHGFMYIGHLPHGFFEEEIKSYFGQFGKVLRVRLARAKKTGNYKGYGFVEFLNVDVATIAAETMNNYLMFNKILKCHLIPKEKINPLTFKNANRRFFVHLRSFIRKKFNRKRSEEQIKVRRRIINNII